MSILPKQRLNCTFYATTQQELLRLRKNKHINNAAYVYFALKLENPFCDRPIEINVKQFAFKWGVKESSLYEVLVKLEKTGDIKFLNNKLAIQWTQDFETFTNESTYSQQEGFSGNPESILESQNKFCNPRIDSEISENVIPEPLPAKDSNIPHTIHTSTNSSEFVEEESLGCESTQELVIEKPTLKIKDVPEQPLTPSVINPDLESHLEAVKQCIEPPEDIKEQLLEHPGYAPTYAIYAKRYKWERNVPVSDIPDSARELVQRIKERGRYKVPK